MVGKLLLRGMLLGVLAGLLATAFAWFFGEPSVNLSIAFEEHAAKAAGAMEEPELVSRAIQSTIGLLTGIVVVSAALGGLFGLAFAFARGRLGRLSPAMTAVVLAIAGFVVMALVPQLKYPANPPAVGSPDTIGVRTGLYFSMLGLSILFALLGAVATKRLTPSVGAWNAALAGLALYVAAVAIVMVGLPVIDEAPKGFSPTVLWNFRVASLGISAVIWATLGIGFGTISQRRGALAAA